MRIGTAPAMPRVVDGARKLVVPPRARDRDGTSGAKARGNAGPHARLKDRRMTLFSFRSMSKLALVAALAGSATGCTLTAQGRLRTPYVVVQEAPPPPPPRAVVVARADYIWIEGHQRWDGNSYVWQEGRYERERAGYVYAPGRWQRQSRGHVWIEGSWRSSGRGNGRGNGHGNGRGNGH
jgi:hypothetical protein